MFFKGGNQFNLHFSFRRYAFIIKKKTAVQVINIVLKLLFSLTSEHDELWCWGQGLNGQLGIGKYKYKLDRPFCLSRFIYKYFVNVACSTTHTLAVSSTNKKNFLI